MKNGEKFIQKSDASAENGARSGGKTKEKAKKLQNLRFKGIKKR